MAHNPLPFEGKRPDVDEIFNILRELIQPEALEDWLFKANPAFRKRRPIDLIAAGELEPLRTMIYRLESGEPC